MAEVVQCLSSRRSGAMLKSYLRKSVLYSRIKSSNDNGMNPFILVVH